MNIKKGLKIALLVLSFAIVALVFIASYSVIIIENSKFEYEMLFLLATILGGVLSLVYQIKTIKFYNSKTKPIELDGRLFWVGNIAFSVILFCFGLYFLYFIYTRYPNFEGGMESNMIIILIITILILLVGVFLALETSALYKRILNQKEQNYLDSIDDIKGDMINK